MFEIGADELAHRHTALTELWGHAAECLRAELRELRTAEERLVRFEKRLAERLPVLRGMRPQVAALLQCLHDAPSVGIAVRRSGLGHRRFIADVRHAVGLAPKAYQQVRRLRRTMQWMRDQPAAPLADIAALAGYSDQSHFGREFLAFAGVTPAGYRASAPINAHHLPVSR